jgi:hypothetical protein
MQAQYADFSDRGNTSSSSGRTILKLGHEGVLTRFSSYGSVSEQRQAELIKDLATRPTSDAVSQSGRPKRKLDFCAS